MNMAHLSLSRAVFDQREREIQLVQTLLYNCISRSTERLYIRQTDRQVQYGT